jgi:nucleoside phosphorylase
MDPAHYLASLTGYSHPGRFCLRTADTITDADRHRQAVLIQDYITIIHSTSCNILAAAYRKILDEQDSWFRDLAIVFKETFLNIKDCCYPYVSVPERSVFEVMSRFSPASQAYSIRMPTIDHAITIADPNITRNYLQDAVFRLLSEGYTVEAGLSVVPMPILFALEHCGIADQPKPGLRTDVIQSFFPMPNLAEIEDSFVDGTYKRRNAVNFINHEYQLFYSRFWYQYKKYLSDYMSADHWKHTGESALRACFVEFCKRSDVEQLFRFYAVPNRVKDITQVSRLPLRFPKRLTYFDALRSDYSFARIRHYTHTSPEYFQPYILFTNYAKYVRRFILRAIAEICRAPANRACRLIIPSRTRSNTNYGFVVDLAVVRQRFTSQQVDYIVRSALSDSPMPAEADITKDVDNIVNTHFLATDGQLPAYHFIPSTVDGARPRPNVTDEEYRTSVFDAGPLPGMTLVNIGVGASNARTITDHIAVLRPLCWIMVGHCGGLRNRQRLGDYVMANGYVRRDGVLDSEVPLDAPVHATRVVNLALQEATRHRIAKNLRRKAAKALSTSGSKRGEWQPKWLPQRAPGVDTEAEARQIDVLEELRSLTRVGPVMSVANRNWETSPTEDVFELFEKYRVVAVDMESAALAANAYRYRIPHGTFLCVSDKPLHGAIKMRFFADDFYKSQIDQHLDLAMDAFKWLSIDLDSAIDILNARELRGIDDPPWR